MILAMLMVFSVVVAMVVNVGQAVNRRVALQLVADAGAYTGASKMAEGLNYMAFANRRMQELWQVFNALWGTAALLPPPGTCTGLQAAVTAYEALRTPYAGAYEAINRAYTVLPYVEARLISERNVDQLFPGERGRGQFSFREVLGLPPDDPLEGLITPQRDLAALMDSRQVPNGTTPRAGPSVGVFPTSRTRINWVCWDCCIVILPYLRPGTFNVNVWFQRSDNNPRFFVWRVRVKETPALMFNSFFGPLPAITTVAVAKPVGGEIRRGDAEYLAKLVPVSTVLPGATIRDSNLTAFGGLRRVTH
jgi:hypothetical protein